MLNYLIPRLENLIDALKSDFRLIAKKRRDDEWKRDHYRYIFTVHSQRIYNVLNTSLTDLPAASVQKSTREELIVLRKMIDKMIEE